MANERQIHLPFPFPRRDRLPAMGADDHVYGDGATFSPIRNYIPGAPGVLSVGVDVCTLAAAGGTRGASTLVGPGDQGRRGGLVWYECTAEIR